MPDLEHKQQDPPKDSRPFGFRLDEDSNNIEEGGKGIRT